MESVQGIKNRIRSVTNIKQITKAMELVAATRMRKSQEIALNSRPYAITALEILANLSKVTDPELVEGLPILKKRPIEKTCVVVVTSDKGLAGALNSNVLRGIEKFLTAMEARKEHTNKLESVGMLSRYQFVAVGEKARQYLIKRGLPIAAHFTQVGDYTTLEETRPISDALVRGYLAREWDEVITFSTHFRTALKQEVLMQKIFPVDFEAIRRTVEETTPKRGPFAEFSRENEVRGTSYEGRADYVIEPTPQEALAILVPHLVEMQIYHLILEANASEHAARRAAMKNATDNAEELSSELTLQYNKSRQAQITKEIIEIVSGANAL